MVDDGAALGRWHVLNAAGGISGDFTVELSNDTSWAWGIDSGTTLWVEKVPEPSTLALLALGALGLLIGRRRR